VLEALGEGVAVATPDGRITLANRVAQVLLAGAGSPLLGRSLFEFVDRDTVDHFVERLSATETEAARFTLHPPTGGVLETVMTPFFDDDRRMIGFILVLRDVTRPARSAVRAGRGSTVRDVVQEHAGEVWAYGDTDRLGFRITLPAVEDRESAAPALRGPTFVGAGTTSGVAGAEGGARRAEFYDFSLFAEMEGHLLPGDREQPLAALRCVVFDLDTTGLSPEGGDRIVSVAAIRVRGGAVKRDETFDALVNPRRPIPPASVAFHGITDAMVAEAPPLDVVLPAFLKFAEGAVLVGHQVWFDLRFVAREAAHLGLPPLTVGHPVLDTAALSGIVHGSVRDHGLDAVAQRLGVAVRGRHSALGDAIATAEIFVRLVPLLAKRGTVTLGHAIDAVRAVGASRLDEPTPGTGP
jgi:DNA polymerase-3 subunit epsilon